ncbi:MAG: arginyltransferase [Sphingobacteriia bacterium]|nr:arginyltransferase [Sphingobacteriia bacterium]NCC39026.1 arginyltransferase [Gammaproteobacteria bacterium]
MTTDQGPFTGRRLALYLTGEHDCSYLAERRARTLFVDPAARMDTATYQRLLDQGFRRSAAQVYRPACHGCAACVPVRVPVEKFVPSRAQRRAWHRSSAELTVRDLPPTFHSDHFSLYQRYLEQRHPGGHMAEEASETSYRRFLIEPWGGVTRFIELRLGTRLAAVAVTDVLEHGLSAVYTFFDPALAERSLGTCAILIQIMQARRMGLAHLYLGYWIKASEKMRYKDRFRAIEAWDGRQWITFERGQALDVDSRAAGR